MPLNERELKELEAINEKLKTSCVDLGIALRNGSQTFLRAALRSVKGWVSDIEKAIEEKK